MKHGVVILMLVFLSAPGWAQFWEQTDGPYQLGISSMVRNASDDLLVSTSLVFANDFLALALCLEVGVSVPPRALGHRPTERHTKSYIE